MVENSLDLQSLHNAFEEWMGEIHETVPFRRETPNSEIPTEMDVLYYLTDDPQEEDNIVITAGMSSRKFESPIPRIEIGYTLNTHGTPEDRQQWAKSLAEFAVKPFIEKHYFTTNMIVKDVSLKPFKHTNCVWIMDWFHPGDEYLPQLDIPVRLLRLIPLFESEAEEVVSLGPARAMGKFTARRINFNNPYRTLS